jgi:histidinol-phosphate/aromatic aminotransferase/cobyric acid decarboxylase-like protein
VSATLPPVADATPALRLVKASVRQQGAYTLAAPVARHKINQNEAPEDLDADLKAEILRRAAARPWHRYPEFAPRSLVEQLAAHYACDPDGLLVGNGSNELIQATLGVTLDRDDVLVATWACRLPVAFATTCRACCAPSSAMTPRCWCSTRPTTRPARR